ncbi:hypothetical protein PsorP6_007250 [Peronosclerospora sorghi]|uniref:Uncharacterized protein n=1 Tax=Peronosclerospora sorghi TaxID=230839 RepID=A0ACC0W9N4_9STRA|nr:hypothetical protein PsorP6_007250 [Peronosclerospora sorghi]
MTSRQKRPLHAGEQRASMACASTTDSASTCVVGKGHTTGTLARKTSMPAAHEVKELRAEAQKLDQEFSALCAKWKAALPDRPVLLAACTAATQKVLTGRVEQLNLRLKDELLQQQLYFSSLQQKVREAPLWSCSARCQEHFDQMHAYVHLVGSDPASRRKQLQARLDSGVQQAPELIERFTRKFVPLSSPMLPYSQTSTAATTITSPLYAQGKIEKGRDGSVCGTLVSNIFVCKVSSSAYIPRIYQTLVDNTRNTAVELERRLGVLLRHKVSTRSVFDHVLCSWSAHYEVEIGPSAFYARVERQDGEMRGAHTNRVWVGKLVSDNLAVIVADFVDEDDEEEAQEGQVVDEDKVAVPGLRIDTCMMLTIARVLDPETQEPIILVRRVRVHRYNLPPSSSVMHKELQKLLSYFNGDFHVAVLCDAYKKLSNDDRAAIAESEIGWSPTSSHVEEDLNSHDERKGKLLKRDEMTSVSSASCSPSQT